MFNTQIKDSYSDLNLLSLNKSDEIYTIEKIKELSKPIFQKFNLEKVYLFGSYARKNASKDSDIDIMIIGTKIKSLKKLTNLAFELVKVFRKEVDIIEETTYLEKNENEYFDMANKIFYEEICKERVLIYG